MEAQEDIFGQYAKGIVAGYAATGDDASFVVGQPMMAAHASVPEPAPLPGMPAPNFSHVQASAPDGASGISGMTGVPTPPETTQAVTAMPPSAAAAPAAPSIHDGMFDGLIGGIRESFNTDAGASVPPAADNSSGTQKVENFDEIPRRVDEIRQNYIKQNVKRSIKNVKDALPHAIVTFILVVFVLLIFKPVFIYSSQDEFVNPQVSLVRVFCIALFCGVIVSLYPLVF